MLDKKISDEILTGTLISLIEPPLFVFSKIKKSPEVIDLYQHIKKADQVGLELSKPYLFGKGIGIFIYTSLIGYIVSKF